MALRLYTLFFYLLLPFILLRLWLRGFKAPAYRERWWQRLGFVPDGGAARPLWIHAVSVGETLAIAPLVRLLLERQPALPIVMTSMTPTGAERVRALFGDRVQHLYCPYDLPWALKRFIAAIRPKACLVVETELWPNMVASCNRAQVPLLLVNARLSERSARGYRRFSALTRPMLQQLTALIAQDQAGADRFLALGMPPEKIRVAGSIKFDIEAPAGLEEAAQQLRQQWGTQRPVLIGASTHEGEESQLLAAYRALRPEFPELLLMLVPRHPERFGAVAELAQQAGYRTLRRSSGEAPTPATEVYLGDTMGELMALYAAADIAVVGGSLITRGGHNPLEPALLGKPVLMGPHVFNFEEICQRLQDSGGLQPVADEAALQAALSELLRDAERRRKMGAQGQAFVLQNRGALARLYHEIEPLLGA